MLGWGNLGPVATVPKDRLQEGDPVGHLTSLEVGPRGEHHQEVLAADDCVRCQIDSLSGHSCLVLTCYGDYICPRFGGRWLLGQASPEGPDNPFLRRNVTAEVHSAMYGSHPHDVTSGDFSPLPAF